MKDFELKVGDLVKLRNDLEDRKSYGYSTYVHNMKFKGFKKVEKICEIYGEKVALININNHEYQYRKEMLAEVKRPTKYKTIYKREEPILDDKEKEYLANVIRPFRNRIKYIVKSNCFIKDFISIFLYNDFKDIESVDFPYFKKDTMYKNMEEDKEYTLEELGL